MSFSGGQARILFYEKHRNAVLADTRYYIRDLFDNERGNPSEGWSISSSFGLAMRGPRNGNHLLFTATQRPGPLAAPLP